MPFLSRLSGVSLLVLCVLSLPVAAAIGPQSVQSLAFTVMRNGDEIGTHTLKFTRSGDMLDVDIKTNIEVSIAFITVFRFVHQGHEIWNAGKLINLESTTNDDGKQHTLVVSRIQNTLSVVGDGKSSSVDTGILPASLWNPRLVQTPQATLLNTLDGSRMAVQVTAVGEDMVAGPSGPAPAKHYSMRGQLDRDLWYDAAGTLVKMQLKGSDGSEIQYVLK